MRGVFRTVDSIRVSYLRKKLTCEVKNSSAMLRFVKLLRKECLIYGCRMFSNGKVSIFLRYSGRKPLISKIALLSKPSSRKFVTNLKSSSYNIASTIIYTDSFGFKSCHGGQRCSGELVCKI